MTTITLITITRSIKRSSSPNVSQTSPNRNAGRSPTLNYYVNLSPGVHCGTSHLSTSKCSSNRVLHNCVNNFHASHEIPPLPPRMRNLSAVALLKIKIPFYSMENHILSAINSDKTLVSVCKIDLAKSCNNLLEHINASTCSQKNDINYVTHNINFKLFREGCTAFTKLNKKTIEYFSKRYIYGVVFND